MRDSSTLIANPSNSERERESFFISSWPESLSLGEQTRTKAKDRDSKRSRKGDPIAQLLSLAR